MSIFNYLRNRVMAGADWRRQEAFLRDALVAVANYPFPKPMRAAGLDRRLSVTLTSFPPRYPTLALTLKSLLTQATAPDRILLWIAHADLAKLPEQILSLQGDIIRILPCDDLRSFKKLIPALEQFPGEHFVTADDDVYYPPDWLEKLVATHRDNPGQIICSRGHMAKFRADGSIRDYYEWDYETTASRATGPDEAIFPTGAGGVLYPAGCLPDRVLDRTLMMALTPSADDIWFFWNARQNNVRHFKTPGRFEVVDWPSTQEVGLHRQNVAAKANDAQLKAIEQALGTIGGLP